MNVMLTFFILLSFMALISAAEFLKRKFHPDTELTRKFMHVSAGLGVIFWSKYGNRTEYLLLSLFFLLLLAFFYKYKPLEIFHLSYRKSYGEITYMLGLILLGGLFLDQPRFFVPGILALVFPDAIAGLSIILRKKTKKDHLSFLFCFFTALFILLLYFPVNYAVLLAILIATTEFCSPYGLDNLTVPIIYTATVGFLLYFNFL